MAADSRPSRTASRSARPAREAAMQMLYLWEIGRADFEEVPALYWEMARTQDAPVAPQEARGRAERLGRGTVAHMAAIDELIARHAEHWRPSRLTAVDRAILRLAVYELLHTSTPAAVVINESIELAKKFSTEASARFVNGVLDGIHGRVREPDAAPAPAGGAAGPPRA